MVRGDTCSNCGQSATVCAFWVAQPMVAERAECIQPALAERSSVMKKSSTGESNRLWRGKFRLSALAVLLIAGVAATTSPVAAGKPGSAEVKEVYAPRLETPSSPNPFVAFLPDGAAGDVTGWNLYLNAAGKTRASQEAPGAPRRGLSILEQEPTGAATNDNLASAEVIQRFGTAPGRIPSASIAGSASEIEGTLSTFEFVELNGSLVDAAVVELSLGDMASTSGVVGDELAPFGPPDFDFFKVPGLSAGNSLVIDIDTPEPGLDSFVAVWNPDLDPFEIAVNDDSDSLDSFLLFTVPVDGDYYVSVGGFGAFVPEDANDSASPSVTGEVGSEGPYDLTLSLLPPLESDFYSFDLEAGDIVGASVAGSGLNLGLYSSEGTLLIGSAQDITFIHPAVSPLPGGGNAALSYVVERDGRYALSVSAFGTYGVELKAFRPAKERSGGATQTLFIDFDGAAIDPAIFFGADSGTQSTLSPLVDFLPEWGLNPSDEDAVIDAILASVEESLSADVRAIGNNGDRDAGGARNSFDIEILNSRDHADPWGQSFVSRVIVGGTIDELQIPTIGIAQSIDVGDFESEESAVVLLDLLAGVGPFPVDEVDLNNFPLGPDTSIVDLLGVAVGNITAHEAGHFFSNWHTDQFNEAANIQDQGGNLPGFIGIGPDGIFGTADDVDVDFGKDVYNPNEGFAGLEDTLQTISFGLSTGNGSGRR